MNITDPFVLKADVVLTPCAELPDDVRTRIEYEEGDFTLARRRGRGFVQVIDGETAALLALFREPHTIAAAVVENSRVLGRDPRERFEEMLPHLGRFVTRRVLVPAGSDEEQETLPQFESGHRFGRWEIVRCASLIEDSEVHQLRDGDELAALKIARIDARDTAALFENETEILRHLDGASFVPRLRESGTHEERRYCIVDWIDGVDASVAGSRRRHDRAALAQLCASIADAYASLHERGVVHGDVHARNVLVGDDGAVTIVDFGYSRFTDRPSRVGRGGMYYFFEPEHLAATSGLAATERGEQYSVAALLYLLITGAHYLDFRFDREEMARQVREEAPLPFARHGVPPWPDVEAMLFRALAKDPAARYASMRELATLLAAARDRAQQQSFDAPVSDQARAFLEATLRSFARGGEMFVDRYRSPTVSINFGAAGAAIGLLRIAETRGDAALLALADVWRSRAMALIETEGAFTNDDRGLGRKLVGEVTPYHTEAGVHAAAVMLAAAMGEPRSQRHALSAFLRASRRPCTELDLTLGRSGSLLAAALLLPLDDDAALRQFGRETMASIWGELDDRPPIADSPPETYLGMAHGWAGYLYAAMRWCAASGDPLPPRLVERLHEHAELRIAKGRGVYWRSTVAGSQRLLIPGWCHGTAGRVFLFTLAHELLRDAEWVELAELAAWHNWEEPLASTNLCCGSAGRAYALLNLYKHTGATEWLSRARHLANHAAAHAAATSQGKNALWKGELGVAVLIADLESPENARMPFFE
jgi:serine/threonine-protein kinase